MSWPDGRLNQTFLIRFASLWNQSTSCGRTIRTRVCPDYSPRSC